MTTLPVPTTAAQQRPDTDPTLALAIVTLDRAVADYRIQPSKYAALRDAIAAGDLDAMSDETSDVRWWLGDRCRNRHCREELHNGSPTGPLLEPPYCSRRCYEEAEG